MAYDQHITYLKYLLAIALLLLGNTFCKAQLPSLQGSVVDSESSSPLSRATLQLYRMGKKETPAAPSHSETSPRAATC